MHRDLLSLDLNWGLGPIDRMKMSVIVLKVGSGGEFDINRSGALDLLGNVRFVLDLYLRDCNEFALDV